MIPMRLAEVAAAVGGEVATAHADLRVGPEVVIDSREVAPRALFVALAGERSDGHRHVAAALEAGAGAALVARHAWQGPADLPVVTTDDPQRALGRLARHVIDRAAIRGLTVIGVTGSMGKTSTKDLLGHVLAADAPTIAPRNSFNNEIGVPLTATRVDPDTGYLVSEMGARGIGHISLLCELTPPRVGVVLNVAHAHIGEFGSQQAIARAKGELVEALPSDGWAVLNADDPLVAAMADRTRARIAWFAGQRPTAPAATGTGGDAVPTMTVWPAEVTHDSWGRHSFVLAATGHHPEHGVLEGPLGTVRLATPGRAQLSNALAAATAAIAAGVAPERVARALDGAGVTSPWRMELTELGDTTMVVNDAYNANPDAVLATLDTAGTMATDNQRRLGVVLGDMLELGDAAETDHALVGRAAAEAGAQWAVFVGDHADTQAAAAAGAGMPTATIRSVADAAAASAVLPEVQQAGDVVLIKASRGVGLESVAARLAEQDRR